jgi:hypothetical protein
MKFAGFFLTIFVFAISGWSYALYHEGITLAKVTCKPNEYVAYVPLARGDYAVCSQPDAGLEIKELLK